MNNLRKYRLARKLSLSELTELTGIAKSTLSTIENGVRRITREQAQVLSHFFGITKEELLGTDAYQSKLVVAKDDASNNSNLDQRIEFAYDILNDYLNGMLKSLNVYDDLREDTQDKRMLLLLLVIKEQGLDAKTLKQIYDIVKVLEAKEDFKDE